jgi:hypothetical protein
MNIMEKPSHWLKGIGIRELDDLSREEAKQEERKTHPQKEEIEETYNLGSVERTQALMIDRLQHLQISVDTGNKQQQQEHERILAHCRRTEAILEQSRAENEHLRTLLSKTYPVERMRAIAGATLFACSLSVLATFFLQLQVVHPVLATIGIIASLLFLGLAQWRKLHAE